MYCVFMPDYKLKNKIFAHSDECAKKKTIIIKIMKKITLHIICIISFFATACSSNNAEVAGNVKSIVFNSEESVTNSDFNKILDTTFRVIPLATNDECLISNIDRLEIVDGKFISWIICRSRSMFSIRTGVMPEKSISTGAARVSIPIYPL